MRGCQLKEAYILGRKSHQHTIPLRLLKGAAVNADDTESSGRELYRVTLFHKGDFEAQLAKTLEVLQAAGAYINSVDAENYETETGYWLVPITIEILKE